VIFGLKILKWLDIYELYTLCAQQRMKGNVRGTTEDD